MQHENERDILERLPTPWEVRECLGRTLREQSLLKRLLRLTEQVEDEQKADERQEVSHA